mmetsp:Transcript_16952/g.24006  ORF Transcript_16952/g.24006 Transcript_16952/m.24006 type:complete len:94 (+) Transcript_16952:2050-2331(+)
MWYLCLFIFYSLPLFFKMVVLGWNCDESLVLQEKERERNLTVKTSRVPQDRDRERERHSFYQDKKRKLLFYFLGGRGCLIFTIKLKHVYILCV